MKHPDGTMHSASVPLSVRPTAPRHAPGPTKGVVLATYLVNATGNRADVGVECDVVLYRGRRVLRHVPVEQRGGYASLALWVPRPTTRSLNTGEALTYAPNTEIPRWVETTLLADMDGDHVVIDFFDGNVDDPIIRGSRPHPRAQWKPEDGTSVVAHLRFANGEQVLVSQAGAVRVKVTDSVEVHGETVLINTDDDGKGVARLDDEVQVDPLDAALNTTWAAWVAKVGAAAKTIDPTIVQPTTPIKGAITAASETVKAG